jgi:hypothetical protein
VKPKSDIYRDLLPAVNGRRVEFLDHLKLISQLCSLERRTWRGGRDSIDHPPGANSHDDVINCCAGALTTLIVIEPVQPHFGSQSTTAPSSAIGGWQGQGAPVGYTDSPGDFWRMIGDIAEK